MRIWKRLLGTALCLCAAVCLMSVSASAAEHSHPICGETHRDIGDHVDDCGDVMWTGWDGTGEITYNNNIAYVYLKNEVTLTSSLEVKAGCTLYLCLNGYSITKTTTDIMNAGVIDVADEGAFMLCNCKETGTITHSPGVNGRGVYVGGNRDDGTFIMYSGTISGNSCTYDGGGVYVNGSFTMYGGTISGNKAEKNGGGGVSADGSKFAMYGGTISGNETTGSGSNLSGGGALINTTTVVMSGGTISGNKAAGSGGGVHIANHVAQLSGVTISGNTCGADKNGGGVSLYNCGINLSGSVKITGNVKGGTIGAAGTLSGGTDNNIYLPDGKTITITGALTGDPIGVTTKTTPNVGNYVNIAVVSNSSWATSNSFIYENSSSIEIIKRGTTSYLVACNHVYTKQSYDSSDHWYQCPNCSKVNDSTKAAHSGGTATCQEKAKCSTCNQAYGEKAPTNHANTGTKWKTTTTTHTKVHDCCDAVISGPDEHAFGEWSNNERTCSVCNYQETCTQHVEGTPVHENEVPATCEAEGSYDEVVRCTNCGAVMSTTPKTTNPLGHDFLGSWQSDADKHWKKCSRCDEEGAKAPHNFSQSGNRYTCVDCGYTYTVPSPGGNSTPAPSGGGSSSTPTITVPVSGSGDTVHVSASVSGSTAEVKEIKSAELDKIGTDSAVVIDLSGLNKGVTGVTLSTDTIDSICKTEADGVTIKLPGAELRVDRQTLAAVTEQAAGSKVRLVVEPDSTARGTMTAAQKSTLAGMRNAAALEAYFVSDGTRIRDFKGGSVELSIPYRADGAIRVWFLKEDGTREPVSARYDKENAQLILHHFSHYVIEELGSSAAYTVCAKDDSCPLGAFGDLTAAAWYHDGVHYCLENGLMRGVSGGKFLPDGSTTRAQLVTILWRLEGSPETTGAARFSDVAGGAWYTEAVRWAAGCGVVKGYDNGCFGPNDAVTREQMAAILYRYAQHKGYDVSAGKDTNILSFDDAFAVSEYAIPAMQWACGSGMVRGIAQKGGMLLAPRDTTTRAQAATLIMRFQSAFAKEP